jgi:acetyl esterase/lipase
VSNESTAPTAASDGTARMGPPPPPLDLELATALQQVAARMPAGFPSSLTPETLPAMREASRAFQAHYSAEVLSWNATFEFEDRTVPGPPGSPEIPLLICRPTATRAALPAVYYVHGGGMVLGGNREGVTEVLSWAEELNLIVVSVEYRLAPEHPHPAPVEDCYAGLRWAAENAKEIGIDPERILVAGSSAGGGLAAALALLARDRGGPALIGQLLEYPMLDDRNDSCSSHQLASAAIWDRVANETGWTALLGAERGGPNVSPYAAPARAEDLSGLPPAFIDVGSAEIFRDEDVDYAARIWQAGGQAELHVWPGAFHGSEKLAPHAALSQDVTAARLRWLRRLLER